MLVCVCVVSLCVCVCVRSHVVLVWRKQIYVVLLAEIGFLAAAPLVVIVVVTSLLFSHRNERRTQGEIQNLTHRTRVGVKFVSIPGFSTCNPFS